MATSMGSPKQNAAAGPNRLELLLFRLDTPQYFGINVLKVKEILSCPRLTRIPQSNPVVKGVAELRGQTIPIIDLALAIGRGAISDRDHLAEQKVIIAEFNRTVQGFLVSAVDRIIVKDWQDVLPPPKGANSSYITGVIRQDRKLVQIIDVERILGETSPTPETGVETDARDAELIKLMENKVVLVVDDSSIARTQTTRTLERMGIPFFVARDGREALEIIEATAHDSQRLLDRIPLILSDIEMPEMDGYQLTREIRANPKCDGVYVLLHTSLDGVVNADHAQQAGADTTLTKFVPELLASEVARGLRKVLEQ